MVVLLTSLSLGSLSCSQGLLETFSLTEVPILRQPHLSVPSGLRPLCTAHRASKGFLECHGTSGQTPHSEVLTVLLKPWEQRNARKARESFRWVHCVWGASTAGQETARSPEKPAKGEGTFAGHTPLSDRPPEMIFLLIAGETKTYEELPSTRLAENLHGLEFRFTPYLGSTQLHTQAFQSSTGQVHFRSFSVQAW